MAKKRIGKAPELAMPFVQPLVITTDPYDEYVQNLNAQMARIINVPRELQNDEKRPAGYSSREAIARYTRSLTRGQLPDQPQHGHEHPRDDTSPAPDDAGPQDD